MRGRTTSLPATGQNASFVHVIPAMSHTAGSRWRLVADLVRAEGANELLTSYTEWPGDPGPFSRRLGFVPTGDGDISGEAILALGLHR